MKKLLLLAVALVAVSAASAQNEGGRKQRHQKDYSELLPKKGDIATGVDLVGLVKFAGNSVAAADDRGDIAPFDGNIFVKYFIADNVALRGRLSVGVNNETDRVFVQDDKAVAADPQSDKEVIDREKTNASDFTLGLGIEFRRGVRRVQGYAGAELFVGAGSNKTSYKYGNAFSSTITAPSNGYNFGPVRTLKGSTPFISGGVAVFTGVDYFISRSVSLGFEFGLLGTGTTTMVTKTTTEEWDGAKNAVKKETDEVTPKQGAFTIAPRAGVNLMFYF